MMPLPRMTTGHNSLLVFPVYAKEENQYGKDYNDEQSTYSPPNPFMELEV